MKKFLATAAILALVASATAQDLDTTTIADGYDTGDRGNNTGSGTWGASAKDGTEFADYTGGDATGTIRYINTWAGASQASEVETPVVTVTAAHDNPDRALVGALEAIAANPNATTGTDGTKCIIIGDDGGHNGLWFGETDDSNYYVEVDVYCYDKSSQTGAVETVVLAARAARDNDPNSHEHSYEVHRTGGYAITYDAITRDVQAGVYPTDDTKVLDVRASSDDIAAGWHTFRIECRDNEITFLLDGSEMVVIDNTSDTFRYDNGRAGLAYIESGLDAADEDQGHFDDMKAGPTTPADVRDWSLFR